MQRFGYYLKNDFTTKHDRECLIQIFETKREILELKILAEIPNIDKKRFFSDNAKKEIRKIQKRMPNEAYNLGVYDEILSCLNSAFYNIFYVKV